MELFAVFKHMNAQDLFGIVIQEENRHGGVKSSVNLDADKLQKMYYQALADKKIFVRGADVEKNFLFDSALFQPITQEEEIMLGLTQKKH